MKKSFFIAFEGLDGSGKSTQVKLLTEQLEQQGLKIFTTAEPTKNRIGLLIKDIFKHKMQADHRTIAALYAADRLEHILNKSDGMLKKMEEGYSVLTDRYYFSSYAYHGVHMSMDWVIHTNSLSADLLRPDLNIFIDTTPETCMKRLDKSRSTIELYESTENLKKVREKYFQAFERFEGTEKIFITNGDRSSEEIAKDICHHVMGIVKPENAWS